MQRVDDRWHWGRGVAALACGAILLTVPARSGAACVGDCNASGDVTVSELIVMVNAALGNVPASACTAGDANGDGDITINEIIAAVNNALGVCPPEDVTPTPTATPTQEATPTASPTEAQPTPTFSVESTLPAIQETIFNPTCLSLSCHNDRDNAGNLMLDADASYANLVGVTPFNVAARQRGLLLVTPGAPENSFLLTKLTMPTIFDLQLGSRMPLGSPVLTADKIEQIRAWILRGALPDEAGE